jgi:hypothetical protein
VAIASWFRECVQVTDLDQGAEDGENVFAFPRERTEPVRNDGQSAIDLVYQAAEFIGNVENHARRTEIRAESLCRNALEKLRFAETRVQASENALNLAESRAASTEARLSAAELRAKKAETRARELDQALTLIEEAIKTRLLGAGRNVHRSSAAVA